MKKALCIIVCLCLLIPCAFAEELPRNVEESDPAYAWLYENSLVVAERFQWGLDCTWHSFLLSAANVPEQEMLDALAPLRMQDYTQPTAVTFVRADHLLPDEMIETWQAALKAEEEAKAARAALRSAELVNELAIVKLANAEEAVLKTSEEAVKAAEAAFMAAEAAAQAAEGEAVQTAKEIAQAAEDAFKAVEAAAQAVRELEKGEAFLAAKEAAKAAEKTSNMVKEAKKAAEEAAKAAAKEAEETANANAAESAENAENAEKTEKKEKTPAELAAEEAAAKIEAAAAAAEKASKAAEEAFKAKANAIQAAQTLADLQAGKFTTDTGDDSDLEFDDSAAPDPDDGEDDGSYLNLDVDFDSAGGEGTSGDGWDWDWDNWDDSASSGAASQQEVKRTWFIEEDPERDLYHCAPKALNFSEGDKMFSAISNAIQVTGFYTCDTPLDGPCYAVTYYGGLYALLITYYPAGDGFVSVNAQVIYARSADELIKP